MASKKVLTKADRINNEIKRLNVIYDELDDNKKRLAEKLIQNASFMAATLEDLQDAVNREGAVFTSVNGNGFDVTQEHPAQKSYNNMINRYNSTMKQLIDLLPDDKSNNVNKAGDALAKFIADGKPKGRAIC